MRIRPTLREGWSTLLLLWGMILVASIAIDQSDIINGLEIIAMVSTVALLAGLLLAKSNFKDNTAHLFALVYGLFTVFYFVGLVLPGDLPWRERVFDIIARQMTWFGKAIEGGTSRDGLIFVIQTSVIFWLLGYTAAWYTFRKPRVWRVVIPTGLVLLSVVYYYNGPKPLPLYMAGYVLLSLLFVARTYLAARERQWRVASIRYERGIWFDFMRAGFIISLFVLFLSWSLPTLSASPVVGDALSSTRGPWREFQDTWTRLFSSLRSYGGGQTSDAYKDALVLGGPRNVGSTPVMDVFVSERIPAVYWQAVYYDTYEDGRWSVAYKGETETRLPEDGPFDVAPTLARKEVTQTIVNYLPSSAYLYAAPQMINSDRQMFVDYTVDEQGSELISGVRSRYVIRQGDSYQVTSLVSTADATSLRNASLDYPDWVLERYLQLPDTVTPETIALAEELTAEFDNPFDKAIALRDYLRTNIAYNDQIQAPPEGVDPVHYVLFIKPEGYCNYYASAMALMLRSQGIPARIASGYAQGEFDADNSFYRVRAKNAHTWVEVYFPEYGWIQFEPTAIIPLVERPETPGGGGDGFDSQNAGENTSNLPEDVEVPEDEVIADLLASLERDNAAGQQSSSFFGTFPIWQALGAVLILALATAVFFIAQKANERIESGIVSSYSRLNNWARWLGVIFRPTETPYERADKMTSVVPEGHAPIRNLTRQYVHRQFSPRHESDKDFNPLNEWRRLRPLLIRQSIRIRLRTFRKRLR